LPRLTRVLPPLVAAVLLALALCAPPAPAAQAQPPMPYTAVGDSITALGSWPGGWVLGYAQDIDRSLDVETTITNVGMYGATTQDMVMMLQGRRALADPVEGASVVTIEAGINDFLAVRGLYLFGSCGGADNQDCLRSMVAGFTTAWDALIDEVRQRAPGAALRVFTIYYAPAAVDQANGSFSVLNSYLSMQNAHIVATPDARVADIHAALNGPDGTSDPYAGGYLLDDEVHPNWLGQIVMRIRLRNLGYDDMVPPDPPVGGLAVAPDVATLRAASSGEAAMHARSFAARTVGAAGDPLLAGAGAALVLAALAGVARRRRIRSDAELVPARVPGSISDGTAGRRRRFLAVWRSRRRSVPPH